MNIGRRRGDPVFDRQSDLRRGSFRLRRKLEDFAMAQKPEVLKELKALGSDLSAALQQMRKSKEFNDLRTQVVKGIQSISDSLIRSVKAAQRSPQTRKIKRRLTRVAQAGAAEGQVKAGEAQVAAAKSLRKVRATLRQFSSKIRP
jgi:hypothetical protein